MIGAVLLFGPALILFLLLGPPLLLVAAIAFLLGDTSLAGGALYLFILGAVIVATIGAAPWILPFVGLYMIIEAIIHWITGAAAMVAPGLLGSLGLGAVGATTLAAAPAAAVAAPA
ncbi:hypothetical protein, partial [Mycobacterium marinum]|uniref:hypothetical protein n=1 Tax=Mycobacterium marinum TaxID=1781 RepID=UPI0035652013